MRSSRRAAAALAAAVAAAAPAVGVAGCGSDIDEECADSYLTYETFGAGFMASWCRSCHAAAQPMRQMAPEGVDFDTREDVRRYADAIRRTAGLTARMPPAGGPSAAERALLVEWIGCGAP